MSGPKQSHLICADLLYPGHGPELRNATICIAEGRIAEIGVFDPSAPPEGAIRAPIVAPGFIDIQINGARDRQFNDSPDVATIEAIVLGARQGGTAHVLPTFITAPGRSYAAAIDAARDARGMVGVLGLHLEGPFLNPERRGVHEPANMRPVDVEDIALIAGFNAGRLLVTLAPELQPPGTVRRLVEAGVVVFAGHSAATGSEMTAAIDEGLSGATHLFNAMSQIAGRDPGVVGAVLASDSLFAGIIADGVHVAWDNIRMAARLMPDRLCLVTDAMRSLEGKEVEFMLHGRLIRLADGRLTDPDGRLAGAHVAMDTSVRNAVVNGRLSLALALQMASGNPARALGLGDQLGRVALGYRASLTLLGLDLASMGVLVDGRYFQSLAKSN